MQITNSALQGRVESLGGMTFGPVFDKEGKTMMGISEFYKDHVNLWDAHQALLMRHKVGQKRHTAIDDALNTDFMDFDFDVIPTTKKTLAEAKAKASGPLSDKDDM